MKLEDIQRTIDALREQKETPYAVIMSQNNYDLLLNIMIKNGMLVITKDPSIIFGLRIEGWPYFPEDSILCVTKDGYEKIKKGYTEEALPSWIKNLL